MNRILRLMLALALGSTGMAALAQELVVFKDYRSLIVQSHRVEGEWTYFKLGSGEMAVQTAAILAYENEHVQMPPAGGSSPSSPSAPASRPDPSAQMRTPPPPPMPTNEKMNDEDEDRGRAGDDEGPEEGASAPPPKMPASLAPRMGVGTTAIPTPGRMPH